MIDRRYGVNTIRSLRSARFRTLAPFQNLKTSVGNTARTGYECLYIANHAFAPMRTMPSKNRAFSLLELIIVIFIIGIIAVFVTPAASTILRGSQISQAEQILTDQVKLGRQEALIRNHNIEVRFIQYGDPELPGEKANDPSTGYYRAIQLMEILDNGAIVPIYPPQILPQSVVINSGNLSTMINDPSVQPPTTARQSRSTVDGSGGDPSLPKGINMNYRYVYFRFRPDGSTTLSTTSGTIWCITLHNFNDKPTGNNLPPNFVTLQLDPISGSVRIYRPSV